MARIMGRTDDRIVFGGVGFFPSQIEEILREVEGASPHYQIILDRQGGGDTLEIKVEVSDRLGSLDAMKALGAVRAQIAHRIKAVLDVDAKVSFVEPRSLGQAGKTPNRVVDHRNEIAISEGG